VSKKKRLVIHIGSPKTGTSYIQNALEDNSQAILKLGYQFPSCFKDIIYLGQRNHIPAATLGLNIPTDISQLVGTGPDGTEPTGLHLVLRDLYGFSKIPPIEFWPQQVQEYKDILFSDLLESPTENAIISSEAFFHTYQTQEECCRLIKELSYIFSKIDIIVYLRRQIDYASSQWLQCLREGSGSKSIPKPEEFEKHYMSLNYFNQISMWQSYSENVIVRPYQSELWSESNLFMDFLHYSGIDENASTFNYKLPPRSNVSFSPIYSRLLVDYFSPSNTSSWSKKSRDKFLQLLDLLPPDKRKEKHYTHSEFDRYSRMYDMSNLKLSKSMKQDELTCLLHNDINGQFFDEKRRDNDDFRLLIRALKTIIEAELEE